MGKTHCTNCKSYKEFKKSKISYVCDKTLLLSSICNVKGGRENEKRVKEEESIEILKILGSISNMENTDWKKKNISQEIRLKI